MYLVDILFSVRTSLALSAFFYLGGNAGNFFRIDGILPVWRSAIEDKQGVDWERPADRKKDLYPHIMATSFIACTMYLNVECDRNMVIKMAMFLPTGQKLVKFSAVCRHLGLRL